MARYRRLPDIYVNAGPRFYHNISERWVTKPLGKEPTPYKRITHQAFSDGGSDISLGSQWAFVRLNSIFNNGYPSGLADDYSRAYNKAYGKLISELQGGMGDPSGGKAQVGLALIEIDKTAEFVAQKMDDIWKLTKLFQEDSESAEKRRREAINKLLIHKKKRKKWKKVFDDSIRRRWGVPRWLSARWLEYWLCIAPTIGDVHQMLAVLTRDLVYGDVHGTAKFPVKPYQSYDRFPLSGPQFRWTIQEGEGLCHVRVGCKVRISNPNMTLANSLGLLNPLTIGAELVPFSFVVGWFLNWNQVLESYSDFAGYEVQHGYVTCFGVISDWKHSQGSNIPADPPYHRSMNGYTMAMHRRVTGVSIPTPKLHWSWPKVSVSRAATSMSLIVSLLTNDTTKYRK